MTKKLIANLDVKSLHTNIPVDKCLNLFKKHLIKGKKYQAKNAAYLSLIFNVRINKFEYANFVKI